MSDNELFRVTRSGIAMYGPYDTLAVARNVASQMFGGWWQGKNHSMRNGVWNGPTNQRIQIQKLTPVLKPLGNGSLQLDVEWVDLP